MTLKCVIADDERLAREHLERLVADDDRLECVASVGTGQDAVDSVRATGADVVFMDIRMPGMTGVEAARALQGTTGQGATRIVFTTAFDEHAVTAFELQAIDYILKPFSRKRFGDAVDRMLAPNELAERLAASQEGVLRRLTVRTRKGLVPVAVSDVFWFEACDDYVRLHTADGAHLVHVRIRDLTSRLPGPEFVRVHRSHLVQIPFIDLVEPKEGGRAEIVMQSGVRIPASRTGMRRLKEALSDDA